MAEVVDFLTFVILVGKRIQIVIDADLVDERITRRHHGANVCTMRKFNCLIRGAGVCIKLDDLSRFRRYDYDLLANCRRHEGLVDLRSPFEFAGSFVNRGQLVVLLIGNRQKAFVDRNRLVAGFKADESPPHNCAIACIDTVDRAIGKKADNFLFQAGDRFPGFRRQYN